MFKKIVLSTILGIAFSSPVWATEIPDQSFSLFALFQLGGPFMWALLAFGILSMAFMLERFWHFTQHKFDIEKTAEDYINNFKEGNGDITAKMVKEHPKNDMVQILGYAYSKKKEGWQHVEKIIVARLGVTVSKLEQGLNVLASVGSLAPLTGFLGTVSGMIAAFQTIANADQVNARMVAGGIFEALITTAFGLIIAIITMAAYNYFVHKIENFTKSCEALSNSFMENLY